MPKQYNEEIAKLKRRQFWIKQELKEIRSLLEFKKDEILQAIYYINKLKLQERYDEVKPHHKRKVWYLKEQEALISLQCKLHTEQGETGREILKLRQVNMNAYSVNITKI